MLPKFPLCCLRNPGNTSSTCAARTSTGTEASCLFQRRMERYNSVTTALSADIACRVQTLSPQGGISLSPPKQYRCLERSSVMWLRSASYGAIPANGGSGVQQGLTVQTVSSRSCLACASPDVLQEFAVLRKCVSSLALSNQAVQPRLTDRLLASACTYALLPA